MSTINRLSSVDALQPGDLIPVWDGSNGDTRKASLTTLLAFIESNFADPDYSTRIVAPNVDGFNVDIGNTGDSFWLIVNPDLNYTTGSITLPSTAYAVNDQEITVVFTAQVSSFSITGAGATVLGAPIKIGTYDSFRVRYNAAQLTWYAFDTTDFVPLANTLELEYTSQLGTTSVVGAATGYVVRTNYYDANVTAGSGATFKFTGVTTLGKAGNVPDADGYFYDADGKQFQNTATVKVPEQFGALGDGVTEDHVAIGATFAGAGDRGIVQFLPAKTYLFGDRVSVTTVGLSYTILWDGATLKLADGAGCNLLGFFHSATDPRDYIDNYIYCFGAVTLDANGKKQQFANAAKLRDGTGTIDAPYNTATGQAYRDATATVFGSRIWATANNDNAVRPYLIEVHRYDRLIVTGANVKDRVEDGFVPFNCRYARFEACTDRDAINTNDQFVITFVNGGAEPGHQHFGWKGQQAKSWGMVKISLTGTIIVGNTITDATTGASGVVYLISGSDYYIDDVVGGYFEPGNNVQVSAVTQGTVTYFNLKARGIMDVVDCESYDGNSGAGYIDTVGGSTGSKLTVRGGFYHNNGTAAIRSEGAESLVVEGTTIINDHVTADKTKSLLYGSQNGISISNTERYVEINCPLLVNASVDGADGIGAPYGKLRVNATFRCTDRDPLLQTDGVTIAAFDFVDGPLDVSGRMFGVLDGAGNYVVRYGQNGTLGALNNLEFEYIGIVSKAARNLKNVRGRYCQKISTDASCETDHDVELENIQVRDIDGWAFDVRGNDIKNQGKWFAKGIRIYRTQNGVFNCGDDDVQVLHCSDSYFEDIGLDTGAAADARAVFGATGGMDIRNLVMDTITLRKVDTNAATTLYYTSTNPIDVYESNVNELDGTEWTRTSGYNSNILHRTQPGGLASITIAAGVVTKPPNCNFMVIDTEAAAATDDLTNILGGISGDFVTIMASNTARTVVVKDGTLRLAGDCTLDSNEDTITLIKRGSIWEETSRSNNGV
jgi:hypothetical protein